MSDRIARLISIVFEPFSISLLTLILIVSALDIASSAKVAWFLTAILFVGLPPLAVLLFEKKTGRIKDWFISDRHQRKNVHLAWVLGSLVFLLLVYLFEAPRLLLAFGMVLFFVSLVITVTNMFWKISVHMVGICLFVLTLLLIYSPGFIWTISLIALVGWARIQLRAHTFKQVLVGCLSTLVITYSVFSFFGLASF